MQRARRNAPERRFALIVTDVRMPGMSGLDVIDLIRAAGHTTLAVTAFPQDETRQRARELEVRLLAKPFNLETLHAAVEWTIRVNAAHWHRLAWSP